MKYFKDLGIFSLHIPMFGSMSCWAHQDHIALRGSMTSIDQQGSCIGSYPTLPFPNPHYNLTFGSFDLVSSPVWWEEETNINIPAEAADGRGRLSVPSLVIALRPMPN